MTKTTHMRVGVTTDIRRLFQDQLGRAGDIASVDPDLWEDETPAALRAKIRQALSSEGMTGEMRTVNGKILVRRTDFPTSTLPGVSFGGPSVHDLLWSCRPWPDETMARERTEALSTAAKSVSSSNHQL